MDVRVVPQRLRSETAHGFREAVTILEGVHDLRPIDTLHVLNGRGDARSFHRFVTLLGQPEGGSTVRTILFGVDLGRLPHDDMELLFGTVLPAHRTLQEISIHLLQLPSKYFRTLTESIPTAKLNPLSHISVFCFGAIDPEWIYAVVDMLKRNAAIEGLSLGVKMGADQCKLICQALPGNTNLECLRLRDVAEVVAGTLDGVATSSLQHLHVTSSFSQDGASSLARQLRTSATLLTLRLVDRRYYGVRHHQALLDLVKTYNYTLISLDGNLGSEHDDARVREQFQGYLSRNRRIQRALEVLQDPVARRVATTQRLPSLLGLVSDLPTGLYRVLKMGYVNEVGDRLASQSQGDDRRHHP